MKVHDAPSLSGKNRATLAFQSRVADPRLLRRFSYGFASIPDEGTLPTLSPASNGQ
jgi:hypothetical protein